MLDTTQQDLDRLLGSPPYGAAVEEQRAWLRAVMQGLGIKGQPFATGAGLAPSTVNRFLAERSRHRLRATTLNALVARAEELTLAGIDAPAPAERCRIHRVPRCTLDNYAHSYAHTAGQGESSPFDPTFLQNLGASSLPALCLVQASGDAMHPTVSETDQLLIDRGVRTVRKDGLYLLQAGDCALLRRITLDPLGETVMVTTDNPLYADREPVAPDRLKVAGSVLWIGRSL